MRTQIKEDLNVQKETLNEKYLYLPSEVGVTKNGAFKYLRNRV